jgi:glutaconate CoA-transferase, subunit B
MTALHPGTTVQEAKEETGWELEVAEELETTDPPTEKELGILRELKARTEVLRNRVRRETRGEV